MKTDKEVIIKLAKDDNVDISKFDIDQVVKGFDVELEHFEALDKDIKDDSSLAKKDEHFRQPSNVGFTSSFDNRKIMLESSPT